jgi:hypothetical protein
MLLDIDTNHPVFRDFKSHRLQSPCTLIYPSGASGNFLAGLITHDYWYHDSATNDWGAPTNFLVLDDCTVGQRDGEIASTLDLDQLWTRAKDFVDNPQVWNSKVISTAHEAPYITSHVVDFHTDELIVITLCPDQAWIPELLRNRKNRFITDFTHKPWSLIGIVNSLNGQGPIDYIEYLSAMEKLQSMVRGVYLRGTEFSIRYFCDCKQQQNDPSDFGVFEEYVRANIQYSNAYQRFECQYYQQSRAWCAQRTPLYTAIDYCDFFFGLCMPQTGRLANLDVRKIAEYSRNNLDLLDQFLPIIPMPERACMQDLVRELRQKLDQASYSFVGDLQG